MGTGEVAGDSPAMHWHPIEGEGGGRGVKRLLLVSCYRNYTYRLKLPPYWTISITLWTPMRILISLMF